MMKCGLNMSATRPLEVIKICFVLVLIGTGLQAGMKEYEPYAHGGHLDDNAPESAHIAFEKAKEWFFKQGQ